MSSKITAFHTSAPSNRRSIICHAVETDTVVSPPCARHLDPAVLVGLSLAYARHRASIPAAIAVPLTRLADQGDATCRLVVDWLEDRSGPACDLNLDPGPDPDPDYPVVTTTSSSRVARSHWQRAIEGPRAGSMPSPSKDRDRPRARFDQNAIIAATEESR